MAGPVTREAVTALVRDVFALALRVPHRNRQRDLRRRAHDLSAVRELSRWLVLCPYA